MTVATADFLLIGGGAIGLAVAYELSRDGHRVRIVEQQTAGQQTSWAAAGILPATSREAQTLTPLEQLERLSARLHAEWAERLEQQTGCCVEYERRGGIHLATRPGEAAALQVAQQDWVRLGLKVEPLDTPDDWAAVEPHLLPALRAGTILRGVRLPDEARVRSPRWIRALLRACQDQGVELHSSQRVIEWQRSHGRLQAVMTDRDRFAADHFCVTAGPWSGQLLHRLGLQVPLQPWRGQALLLAPQTIRLTHTVNEGPNYLVPRRDGRVVVGATVEDVGFDLRITDQGRRQLQEFAARVVPDWKQAPIETHWAGLRPATGDGRPLIGPLPGLSNAYLATGHYRSGIFLAPATALVMSQLMQSQPTAVAVEDFGVTR